MENHPIIIEANTEQIILHAGFRFHPTNEELIIYYLVPKSLNVQFKALAIGEADLRKMEPWELPWVANMGEDEWYFFCRTEKRYPTGQRTNRGTKSGYWKATGKDHEIYSGKILVGMKKTLVFYRGRAPKGVKSNWVMHEFRLDGKYSKDNLHESAQGKWVISRFFHKDSSGKKTHISALPDPNSQPEDVNRLPPLTDFSPGDCGLDIKSPSTPSHCQQPCSMPENPLSSSLPLPHFPDQLLIDENDFLDSLRAGLSNYAGPGGGDGGGGGYFAGGMSVDEYISSLLDV